MSRSCHKPVPWSRLSSAEQAFYLREAAEYIRLEDYRETDPQVTLEVFEHAVRQAAEENYYAVQEEKAGLRQPASARRPGIEERAQRIPAALGKRIFTYRGSAGRKVRTDATGLPQVRQNVRPRLSP